MIRLGLFCSRWVKPCNILFHFVLIGLGHVYKLLHARVLFWWDLTLSIALSFKELPYGCDRLRVTLCLPMSLGRVRSGEQWKWSGGILSAGQIMAPYLAFAIFSF